MIGLCFMPFALSGCGARKVTAEQAPVSVKVRAVETVTAGNGVRYSASIEPQTQVELAFNVGGYVAGLLQVRGADGRMRAVQAGDVVRQGTVLARVRPADYQSNVDQAKARLRVSESSLEPTRAQAAEAEAALERAKLDFERAARLLESQSLTKPDYDAAKANLEMTQAKAEAARAQIAVTNAQIKSSQAALTDEMIPLQDTALRAPLNAIVLQRTVEVGTLVAPGRSGFVLADTSSVKAVFGVPDLTVAKLKLGDALTVTTEALPGTEFRGQITRVSPAADAKSRVFSVEVTIPNPRQSLKAGLIASLELAAAGPPKQATTVPLTAIVRAKAEPNEYAVFVVETQGNRQIARLRGVKLGETFGNAIAVIEGVGVGERVITTGATLVEDGRAVQVIP
jgi:RND family efflux transporter MFP subunit